MDDAWCGRLREAIERTGRKHSDIAWSAGVAPETLSRILTGEHARPRLETITRIAHEAGVTVGWLLGEREFRIGAMERDELQRAAKVILDLTGDDE